MLRELHVENYAVIDHVAVKFAPGLNLLTGETGAGKSLLIDALALLLGDKASSDVVRHGAEKASVACVFDLGEGGTARRIRAVLEENGVEGPESGELILKRDILSTGKARVFVNNQPATVAVLKQLAPHLASVHAQNESILAFDFAARLAILDRYAAVDITPLADAFSRVRELRARITGLERDEQDRLRLADLWSFQKKEIEAARLESGEDERLESERRVLANSEKLYGAAMSARAALYDDEPCAIALLRFAEKHFEELARYESKFAEAVATLQSARMTVEDASSAARDFAQSINASPERLAEVEDRLVMIDRLKRKYGGSVDEVLRFGQEAAQKLSEVEDRDEILDTLRKDLKAAASTYLELARAASKRRYETAKKLERLVEAQINDLAMKSNFRIEITGPEEDQNWSPTGFDTVAYLISTNPGEPMKPIEEIASGGEMSRVMLALKASVEEGRCMVNGKTTARKGNAQRTLVFDEIDAGIGGRAAEAVGRKLKTLARDHQVLCITHLPQIASFADHHLVIEKRETAGRTRTSARALTSEERTEEVARMLSGAKLTDTSLRHAEQMLKANA